VSSQSLVTKGLLMIGATRGLRDIFQSSWLLRWAARDLLLPSCLGNHDRPSATACSSSVSRSYTARSPWEWQRHPSTHHRKVLAITPLAVIAPLSYL
jgi:hypothetical protein